MMTHATLDQLRTLKLFGMADALTERLSLPAATAMDFEARLTLLVDREVYARDERRRTRLLQRARLKYPQAALEDLDTRPGRGLDQARITSLALSDWITAGHSVLLTGPTGCGKTWLACALGQYACRRGHSVAYLRTPRLAEELRLLHGAGAFGKWYIGVSAQTLRRWESGGKLRPVRHAGNKYRYYRCADLEPFRLEYQRAEMAVTEGGRIFKTLPADVEGNDQLREPQREAHRAVREHFAKDNEHVILQIPVGCGKTGVIATLPFGIAEGRALVITPNLAIRKGVSEALDIANPKNFWRRSVVVRDYSTGPYRAVLDGADANLHHSG